MTDAEINTAFLGQDANLFGLHRLGESGSIVRSLGSTVEDFSIAPRASRVTRALGVGRELGLGGVRMTGRFLGFAGDAFLIGDVVYRSSMIGYNLREGNFSEAAMQVVHFAEDLVPVPSARPDHISFPDAGPDTQWTQDPQGLFGRKSGCTVCHESVAVDNWAKSTAAGQQWEMLNGPAITSSGIAKDQARNAWLAAGAGQY